MHSVNSGVAQGVLRSPLVRFWAPLLEGHGVSDEDLVGGKWIPPVDVIEEGDAIVLLAELPGLRQDAIEIRFAEGTLTIRGERPFGTETESKRYHRIERLYGSFARSFTLPRTVDSSRIKATFVDGILEIVVPKREEAKPRQIRIDVK